MNEMVLILYMWGSGLSVPVGMTAVPFKYESEADCRAAGKAWSGDNRSYRCLPMHAPEPKLSAIKPEKPYALGGPRPIKPTPPPPRPREALGNEQ
jgi:hypothetical protein